MILTKDLQYFITFILVNLLDFVFSAQLNNDVYQNQSPQQLEQLRQGVLEPSIASEYNDENFGSSPDKAATAAEKNFYLSDEKQLFLISNRDIDDLELTNLIIVSQVDGSLSGLNRQTGQVIWNTNLGPVVSSTSTATDGTQLGVNTTVDAQEFWAVEPYGEGSLYFFTRDSGLTRVPLSIRDLILASPFSVDNDDKIFTGSRKSSMVYVNVKTGHLIDDIKNLSTSSKCCANSGGAHSETSADDFICIDNCSNYISIGKTDYELIITSKSNKRSWNISYTKFGENNLHNDLKSQNLNSKSIDGALVFPFQEKSLLSIDVNSNIPKWVASLNSTCINVFDVYTDLNDYSDQTGQQDNAASNKFVLISHPIKPSQSEFQEVIDKDEKTDDGTYLGVMPNDSWFAMSSENYPSLVKSSSSAGFYNSLKIQQGYKVSPEEFVSLMVGVHKKLSIGIDKKVVVRDNNLVSTTILSDSKRATNRNNVNNERFPSLVNNRPRITGGQHRQEGEYYSALPEGAKNKREILLIDPPIVENDKTKKSYSFLKFMLRLMENSVFTVVVLVVLYYSSRAGFIPPLTTIMYKLGFMKRTHYAVEFAERILSDTDTNMVRFKDHNTNTKVNNNNDTDPQPRKSNTFEEKDKSQGMTNDTNNANGLRNLADSSIKKNTGIGNILASVSEKKVSTENGAMVSNSKNIIDDAVMNNGEKERYLNAEERDDLERSIRESGILDDMDIDIQVIREKLIKEIKHKRAENAKLSSTSLKTDRVIGQTITNSATVGEGEEEDDDKDEVSSKKALFETNEDLEEDEESSSDNDNAITINDTEKVAPEGVGEVKLKKVRIDEEALKLKDDYTDDKDGQTDEAAANGAAAKSGKKRKRGSRGGKNKKKGVKPGISTNSISNLDEQIANDNDIELVVKQSNRNDLGISRLVISDDILGYGSHGTVVYKGTFENRPVAVKRMLIDFYDVASHEVTLLQESDDHPNVIRYFCSRQSDRFLYIALELCSANLEDLIEKKPAYAHTQPNVNDISSIIQDFKSTIMEDNLLFKNCPDLLYQMTSGLHHLHKLNIVHRDIKPQNILVTPSKTKDLRVLISDFGLCKKLEPDQSSFRGTTASGTSGWRAPELLNEANDSRISKAVDIFSLGLVFYYVLTKGKHPYGDRYNRESNILQNKFDLNEIPSCEAKDLISKMLESNPKKRLSTEAILKHPFFWNNEKKIEYLLKVSDKLNILARDSDTILKFEKRVAPKVFNKDWKVRFDPKFFENINTFRKYDSSKLLDLLRVIRNKYHHINEIPEEFHITEENFYEYFSGLYPELLISAYYFIEKFMKPDFENFYN